MTQDPKGEELNALIEIVRSNTLEMKKLRRTGLLFKVVSGGIFAIFVGTAVISNFKSYQSRNHAHAAVIHIDGEIAANSEANATRIMKGLRNAFSAEKSLAVVLDINSPGGSPVQAGMIHDEIKRLKAKYPEKRVVSVIGDAGASGGYYIAVAADKIYANRASLVGSIGVRLDSFGFTEVMKKIGVERRLYTAGKYKGVMDMFTDTDPDSVRFVNELLESVHQQFIQVVKEGRGDRLKDDGTLFTGLAWSGESGLALGLIDGYGDQRQVVEDILKIESALDYTPMNDIVSQLAGIHVAITRFVGLTSKLTELVL